MVCLYCYGSIVHIAYLYKVDLNQHFMSTRLLNNIIVFKFQLRAHTKLIIPLADHWMPTKVIFVFDIYDLFVNIPR